MEIFDICDESGLPTGKVVDRETAHREGIRHRTAHVWVINPDTREVLLQKRSENKDSFPGRLDTSAAGHIHAGDEPKASALRELEEELGIHADADALIPIGGFDIRYRAEFRGKPFADNEWSNVYAYTRPVDISALTLQAEEVSEVVWEPLDDVIRGVEAHDRKYCVPVQGLYLVRDWMDKTYAHAARAARNFTEKGYTCAQSVLCAYADELGLDEMTALHIAAPFGGGVGRQREMCGTVSAALMVLGMRHSPDDPTDIGAKAELYRRVQTFCARFRERNGSTVCRELLGGLVGQGHVPEARTAEYYKKRPCARMCFRSAEILDALLEEIKEGKL